MQGPPEGDRHYGWWRFHEVSTPDRLRIEDGFGDAEGNPPDAEMPESGEMIVDFEPTEAGGPLLDPLGVQLPRAARGADGDGGRKRA